MYIISDMGEIDLSKKYNFKIRNKKTGKFVTGNKSKSTWMQPGAVCDRIKGSTGWPKHTKEDLEVILFQLDDPLTIPAVDFLEYHDTKRQAKKSSQAEKDRKLRDLLKDMRIATDFKLTWAGDFRDLHDKNVLREEIQNKLRDLLSEYSTS